MNYIYPHESGKKSTEKFYKITKLITRQADKIWVEVKKAEENQLISKKTFPAVKQLSIQSLNPVIELQLLDVQVG